MSPIQQMLLGAGAGVDKIYIESLFNSFIYNGTGASHTINTGVDLSGGGLVHTKNIATTWHHSFIDSARGLTKYLRSSTDAQEGTDSTTITSFNDNGFTAGADSTNGFVNYNGSSYISYCWKKQEKFFDVQTFTLNASGSTVNVSHDLNCVPGMVAIKKRGATEDWFVWHKDLANNTYLRLNLKNEKEAYNPMFGSITSSVVPINDQSHWTGDYVMYLWAHNNNDGIFGATGDQDIIKCGTYTGTDGSRKTISVGFEPQFVLIKCFSKNSTDWSISDNLTGFFDQMDGSSKSNYLAYNRTMTPSNDSNSTATPCVTHDGFTLKGVEDDNDDGVWNRNEDYVWVAVRRPDGYVGKPKTASESFAIAAGASLGYIANYTSNFPVDFVMRKDKNSSSDWRQGSRLMGPTYLESNTNDEIGNDSTFTFNSSTGWGSDSNNTDYVSWMWSRGLGHDVRIFSGTGNNQTISHSMNQVPEFILFKNLETGNNQWYIYHKGLNNGSNPEDYYIQLGNSGSGSGGNSGEAGDSGGSLFNSTAPTSTNFYVGSSSAINESGKRTVAFLFSSRPGISKVGYYSGTGSNGNVITLGFSPKIFILKRVDDSGSAEWRLLDTFRGFGGSGATSDEFIYPNTNQAEEAGNNFVTSSTGVTINTDTDGINKNGGRYIYYAHA